MYTLCFWSEKNLSGVSSISDINNIACSRAAVVSSHAKNAICLTGLEKLPSHQVHVID